MGLISYSKLFATLISLAFASHAAYYYYARKKKKEVPAEIHEVIMFSEAAEKLVKSKYSRSAIRPSMERVLYYLNLPRHTLDICMYVLTNQDMANTIAKLNYRRVKVRIIIDADMAFASGSAIRRIEKQGVEVRWMKSSYLMHHKFCLIDALDDMNGSSSVPLLIAGSLNWTNQALFGNYEDVLVTSQATLVQQYKEEFERLWVLFKPIV